MDRPEREIVAAESVDEVSLLLGDHDEHVRALREVLGARVQARGPELEVSGEPADVEAASQVLRSALGAIRAGYPASAADIRYAARRARAGDPVDLSSLLSDTVVRTDRGKDVRPRTTGQKTYVAAMREYELCFGIGPAGTGKTYLAMAMAIAELKAQAKERIILTRPAVEAGENLGFLPGDLRDKVDPYLRPLYDALYDMVGVERGRKLLERSTIEVVPLAYMRGRTLNDAFIILDEAQNTTVKQMQMFLTRMGFHARIVVTGDVTQVDLPEGAPSGLIHAMQILDGVDGIACVRLTDEDVVRHPLVRRIIRAYETVARPTAAAPSPPLPTVSDR